MFRTRILGVTVLALALVAFTAGDSAATPGVPGAFSTVFAAPVEGLVLYADGITPAAEVPVRVWDVDKQEFVHITQTDKNGYFKLPQLETGKYYITFDWLKVELLVVDKAQRFHQQPHDIVVVIPRGLGFVSIPQLHMLLVAATISEAALIYEPESRRPPVVSP